MHAESWPVTYSVSVAGVLPLAVAGFSSAQLRGRVRLCRDARATPLTRLSLFRSVRPCLSTGP